MKENTLDIIKGALLIEYRGKALYEQVAQKTENAAVKELFQMLVNEEVKHVEILSQQYKLVSAGGDFNATGLEKIKNPSIDQILTKQVVKEIKGAGYEAAVIDSALELEKKAVAYYGEKEAAASTDDEKKLFNWLVKWEKEHMIMLGQISNEIREQVWYDNNFWPLD